MLNWLLKLCTLSSQIINALVFNGNVDETISGRVYRERRYQIEKIINGIFWFDEDHCKKSHDKDIDFAEFIMKYKRED